MDSHTLAKEPDGSGNKGAGSDMYVNLTQKPSDGAPNMIIQAHEEIHADDNDKGVDRTVKATGITLKTPALDVINAGYHANYLTHKADEVATSRTENIIRNDLGIAPRETYFLKELHALPGPHLIEIPHTIDINTGDDKKDN
ncbi:hypothetical protein [Mucilaginibacter ginsenosidivorans]|uniref:Uncharacterized protein n=1 Tax=Mucilaginibacter ginsenosidivorans TaxID=398053 RepID=A0A5B8UVE8_9SPHI|nr:hypothetical protein [Mucilaginibacter ginsenosidivorans]QEC63034.1 hypothetical protein FRZ54_10730 [Mucilaginibacter ginsenosidivorans]